MYQYVYIDIQYSNNDFILIVYFHLLEFEPSVLKHAKQGTYCWAAFAAFIMYPFKYYFVKKVVCRLTWEKDLVVLDLDGLSSYT